MASIMGFQMKNVKNIEGREGYGCSGTMYVNGKKVGKYVDYGDGAPESIEYVSDDARKSMIKLIIEYAKIRKNDFRVELYMEKPEQFKAECVRFKKDNPFIPYEDITIETMASNSEVYIISDFLSLLNKEKLFKKYSKKGYRAIGVKNSSVTAFPLIWSDEKINEFAIKNEIDEVYKTLDDFIL